MARIVFEVSDAERDALRIYLQGTGRAQSALLRRLVALAIAGKVPGLDAGALALPLAPSAPPSEGAAPAPKRSHPLNAWQGKGKS